MAIRINWITIFVNDMAASQMFYGDYLGLTKAEEFPAGPDMDIAFFEADNGMKVELIENRAAEAAGKNPDVIIGVAVDNFDELMEKAKVLNVFLSGPEVLGGHLEVFYAMDPNGVSVQIARM